MSNNARLVGKIDEAIKALKPQKRKGELEGIQLAETLKNKFLTGKSFKVRIGVNDHEVKCANVRISRTTIDLGLGRGINGEIPLTRVTTCSHGTDKEGNVITGYGIVEDAAVIPLEVY
jgi:hypothetical protein